MQKHEQVVVVGASGFGRESLDVLEAMRSDGTPLHILGVVDDAPSDINLGRLADRGVEYLGTIDNWLSTNPDDTRFVLGIGNPAVRRSLTERLKDAGLAAFSAIHPTAIIGSQPSFGPGVVVCAGAVISTNVQLKEQVHVNPNATIGHDSVLEAFVSVNPSAVISGEVHIQEGVLVGAASMVLQQLTIGQHATIGAGALVTKSLPPGVIAIGVPARW